VDLPDDFYEMTPEDVAFEMQLLKEKQQEQENASFKTKLQRERDRLKKLSKFKKVRQVFAYVHKHTSAHTSCF